MFCWSNPEYLGRINGFAWVDAIYVPMNSVHQAKYFVGPVCAIRTA